MKYFIPLMILLAGCSTSRKTASDYQVELLNSLVAGYILEAPLAAPLHIPGGMIALHAPCADFDSGTVKSTAGKLQVDCPDHLVNQDSILRYNPVFKLALAERALAEAKLRQADQKIAELDTQKTQLQSNNSTLEAQLRKWYIGASILAAVFVGWVVFKFKTGGFGLLKRVV